MQINSLELKNKRKKRKTIGRGGKKGTYSGRGVKGQGARSGASINPLFEGGRSTLTDHMKKVRGFKSIASKKNVIDVTELDKKFENGGIISIETLIQSGLLKKGKAPNGVKILGKGEIKNQYTIENNILLSTSAKDAIIKAGGKINSEPSKITA